jgi:hypothetical protein
VFYGNGKRVDARVRKALRESAWDAIVLITGATADHAMDYAKLIASTDELEGVPCNGTDILPVPTVSEEERERRKLRRGKSPEEIFGAVETDYREFSGTKVQVTTAALKDIPESAKYFLMNTSTGKRGRNLKLWNVGTKHMEITGYYPEAYRTALETLLPQFNTPITGYVNIVGGERELKKLKLVELGFKPLLPAFEAELSNPTTWETVTEGFDPMPEVKVDDLYQMRQLGMVGALAYHVHKGTPLGVEVKAQLSQHAIMADIDKLLAKATKSGKKSYPLLEALLSIAGNCTSLKLPKEIRVAGNFEIREGFDAKYPLLKYLAEDKVAHPDKDVAAMFVAMLTLALPTVNKTAHLKLMAA